MAGNPIVRGFDWNVLLVWPAGALTPSDVIRADFREYATANLRYAAVQTRFSATNIALTLPRALTATIEESALFADLVLVRGALEYPLNAQIAAAVVDLTTRS